MQFTDKFLLGIAGEYTQGSYEGARLFTASSDSYHVSVYGGGQWGPLGLRLGSAYTWHDLETGRDVIFPGFSNHLNAEYNARGAQVFGEVGYGLPLNVVSIEPFARLAYVNMRTKGFQERGGASSLRSDSNQQGTAYTTLGVNIAKTLSRLERMITTVRGTIGWRHAFGEMTPVSTFAFANGSSFATAGVPIAHNGIVLAGGVDAHVLRTSTLGIYYQGQILHNIVDHGVRGKSQLEILRLTPDIFFQSTIPSRSTSPARLYFWLPLSPEPSDDAELLFLLLPLQFLILVFARVRLSLQILSLPAEGGFYLGIARVTLFAPVSLPSSLNLFLTS